MNDYTINKGLDSNSSGIVRAGLQSNNGRGKPSVATNLHSTGGNAISRAISRKDKITEWTIVGLSGSGFIYGCWQLVYSLFIR